MLSLVRQKAKSWSGQAQGINRPTGLRTAGIGREMARVLRPGGVLMVTRRRGWEAKTFVGRYRTGAQFRELLQQLGFVDVDTKPWQEDSGRRDDACAA